MAGNSENDSSDLSDSESEVLFDDGESSGDTLSDSESVG